MECLFCKIAQKALNSDIVYEDEWVVAFRDVHPKAPVHILIIPRLHIETLNELQESHRALLGHVIYTAAQLAKQLGFSEQGYRLVYNVNADAGQSVFHIHLHLLGGRTFDWPPG